MYELENYGEEKEQLEGKNLELTEEKLEGQEAQESGEGKESQEALENPEQTDEGKEALGYSSEHYKHEMARAIKNGNKTAYEHAKKNYSHAKVKESLGAGEAAEEGKGTLGYSSKYGAAALRQNTKDYTKAALEANEKDDDAEGKKEALGYSSDYYAHRMETAIKNGNKIALENARKNYAKAKVREST